MEIIADTYAHTPENPVIYIAGKLQAVPYVAHTLEKNKQERLVIDLHRLDCTTFVENVVAIYLCYANGKKSFDDFCTYLRQIRYRDGKVAYTSRLHYFSQWIEHHSKDSIVAEIQSPTPPFNKTGEINISYMSRNHTKYPMLANKSQLIKQIISFEKQINGKKYKYIPKEGISNTELLRRTIRDGDIIAIVTDKSGLDVSHIGFAVWHNDGLHLLNASMIHGKVIEEPMTLRRYMAKQPSRTGIRVIRIL